MVKSGSGDVRIATSRGPSLVETGSGDIHVDHAQAELRIKSGSGDVEARARGRRGRRLDRVR